MGIFAPPEPPSSELTSEKDYLRRREFLKQAGLFTLTAGALGTGLLALEHRGRSLGKKPPAAEAPSPTAATPSSPYNTMEPKTSLEDVTHYNNFYELGTDKTDPARNAHVLTLRPWTVEIAGLVHNPATVDVDTLIRAYALEERVYRMRCVEGWSMVIPWLGFPLAALLKKAQPLGKAKYVAFTTLNDPRRLPGESEHLLDWPYSEGLRLDEAMNPLTLMAVGLYGKALLAQNGAPLRLVVPWKYGFKGIKSIVRIELVEEQPKTTWNLAAPSEYGFYANVNPAVDHPRWSQARERRIGDLSRRDTLPFNGYGDFVASMYAGLDLRANF